MKQQLAALGAAIGIFLVALLPFAFGYFLMAMFLFSGHGRSPPFANELGYLWLALSIAVPLWAAVASYRKVLAGDADASASR